MLMLMLPLLLMFPWRRLGLGTLLRLLLMLLLWLLPMMLQVSLLRRSRRAAGSDVAPPA